MLAKRLIKSNDAGGGGACTNTVDLYNPFPDGGGVALYQLNGDATDVSGNYNGTATNVTYGAGQFGQAAQFNGTSSYIDISSLAASIVDNQNLSISGWFKTGLLQDQVVVELGQYSGGVFRIIILNTSKILGQLTTSAPSAYNLISTDSYNLNSWNHFVLTFNGSSSSLFLNNINQGSLSSSYNINTNDTGFIGKSVNTGVSQTYLNGSIDQVRIFNRALRPYEVEALYTEEYCTPTIVPSEHFNTVLYTGNSSTQSVTGVGFQPDLVWIKRRNTTEDHAFFDSVRGALKMISSNLTAAEYTTAAPYEAVSSFDSDGFTTGDNGATNRSPNDYVAWNFKAGGSAVTNTDGTITSQVSANTEAGFSVVTWTDSFTTGQTVGHGLGQSPKIIMARTLDRASNLWYVSHPEDNTKSLILSSTAAQNSDLTWVKGDNTFGANWTGTSFRWLAYCFAEVEGFSNFGSYVGTGTNTNTIVTGFEPAFIMFKNTTYANVWTIVDNKRNISDPRNLGLFPSSSQAEYTFPGTPDGVKFLSNGFALNTAQPEFNQPDVGNSGGSYIYMAFAADPTTIEPSLEDSFNTVTYTGTGSQITRTDVGFQPDLVWIKGRDDTWDHFLTNSITNGALRSNKTLGESPNPDFLFNSDGFTTPVGGSWTQSGQGYVAWNWKGAELPAINSNGSITSVVSANPAAGFSIVSYTGTDVNNTIGHGLGIAPNVILFKDRTIARNWRVYHSAIGAGQNLKLNTTDAASSDAAIFQSTTPTENVFYVGASGDVNANTDNFIAYCFAEVAGFSKLGGYNGSSSDVYINCGFEPAFVIVKCTNIVNNWYMIDNKRGATSPNSVALFPNLTNAEINGYGIYFDSTGFTVSSGVGSGTNASGGTYIYMAFANQF